MGNLYFEIRFAAMVASVQVHYFEKRLYIIKRLKVSAAYLLSDFKVPTNMRQFCILLFVWAQL